MSPGLRRIRCCAVAGLAVFAVLATPAYTLDSAASTRGATASALLPYASALSLAPPPGSEREQNSIVPAGDVNGDGLKDLIVGVPGASAQGRTDSGVVYVLFGSLAPRWLDPLSLGASGFRIDGPPPAIEQFSQSGTGLNGPSAGSIARAAGDVNGDGLDDLLVGVPLASERSRLNAGAVYVVFGKRFAEPVDLGNLGEGGYRIDGAEPGQMLGGGGVAAAGDVDGDGLDDVLLSAGRDAYVVFGRASSDSVDLRSLGQRGYRIALPDPGDGSESFSPGVQNAGDVNGDGRPDAIVSQYERGIWVVLGAAGSAPVDLADPGGRAYSTIPPDPRAWEGQVVSAGDVNGDGLADLLVSVTTISSSRVAGVYVVFGQARPRPVSLTELGAGGYRIWYSRRLEEVGEFVGNAGDVNGDGLSDVLVTGPASRFRDRFYVVFGKRGPGAIDLRRPGGRAFHIEGNFDIFPGTIDYSAAGLGDIDGDGFGDLAIGAGEFDRACRMDVGAAYVVYGRGRATDLNAERLGVRGFRVEGERPNDAVGSFVAAPGDVNGDGRPDALIASRNEEGLSGGPFSLHTLTGVPQGLRVRKQVPRSLCLRARILDRHVSRVLASGRLRVRVVLRRLQSSVDTLRGEVRAAEGPFARPSGRASLLSPPPALAEGRMKVRSPGVHVLKLKLTKVGRRAIRRGRRLRLVGGVSDLASDELRAQISVTLSP